MAFYKTSTNNFGTALIIVDGTAGQGTHTTIAAALTDASSGQTIFIRPGTYTENLTLKAGVNLCAYECDALTPNVTILGKCSLTGAGTVSISGIRHKTNSDFCISVTGSAASILNLKNCYIDVNNNTAIQYSSSSSSSAIRLWSCQGDIATTGIAYFSASGTGEIKLSHCHFENHANSLTNDTISAGVFYVFNTRYICSGVTTSSTGAFQAFHSELSTATNNTFLTHGGSNSNTNIVNCIISSGSSTAVTMNSNMEITNTAIDCGNSTAIGGTGTLIYCSLEFIGSGSGISVSGFTNRTVAIGVALINNDCKILAGSGSPSGVVTAPKGSLYLRTDGSSTSTRAYINTNSGTTWTAITTAA